MISICRSALAAFIAASAAVSSVAFAAQNEPDAQTVRAISESLLKEGGTVFPIGQDNVAYAKYFTGQTYLAPLTKDSNVGISNVTFAPGVINHWHRHSGSCQVLVGVSGSGWYQIWGQQPQKLVPGVVATIPEGAKHWHGAGHGGWFQHLSVSAKGMKTEWLEPVDPKQYAKLKGK